MLRVGCPAQSKGSLRITPPLPTSAGAAAHHGFAWTVQLLNLESHQGVPLFRVGLQDEQVLSICSEQDCLRRQGHHTKKATVHCVHAPACWLPARPIADRGISQPQTPLAIQSCIRDGGIPAREENTSPQFPDCRLCVWVDPHRHQVSGEALEQGIHGARRDAGRGELDRLS